MPPIKISFFDASVIVKLLCNQELGSVKVKQIFDETTVFTSWILLAEAMGVLKRKWMKKEISEEQYASRIHLLLALIKDRRFLICDIEIKDHDACLKTYEYDLIDIRKKHPELDAADALQLVAIREGILGKLAGKSRPSLITADLALKNAASVDGIQVTYIDGLP